jgi:hypothetical protein
VAAFRGGLMCDMRGARRWLATRNGAGTGRLTEHFGLHQAGRQYSSPILLTNASSFGRLIDTVAR